MNKESSGGGCLGFLIIAAIIYCVIAAYWQYILVIAIVGIALFIFYKTNKKKKEEARVNWISNHVSQLERATKPFVDVASRLQKELIDGDHYVKNEPDQEKTKVYHDLDERAAYLDVAEQKILEVSNKILLSKFPYLKPAENRAGLEQHIHHLDTMFHNLWSGFDFAPDSDNGKEVEKQLFMKHGLDLDYLKQAREYRLKEFSQFMSSLTYHDESYNPIVIERKIIQAGVTGEKRLQEELELYNDVLTALYNVRLEVDGNSVESDAMVISPKGVFTLEAKNFSSSGSYSIRVTKDGQWQKVWPNGNTEPMKDVVSQANRHVAFKQRFINQALRDKGFDTEYVPVQSIIVIANDNVMIDNQSDTPIIRVSQIYSYIQRQSTTLSNELINEITDLLKTNTLEAKRFPHRSYEKEVEQWLNFIIPTAEYAYRAGLAHKAFLEEITAHTKDNPSMVVHNWYQSVEYPLNVDLDDVKTYEQKTF